MRILLLIISVVAVHGYAGCLDVDLYGVERTMGGYWFNQEARTGFISCWWCRPGRYTPLDKSIGCGECPVGKHSQHWFGSTSCTACPAGRDSEKGQVYCRLCSKGKYYVPNSPCIGCPSGYYADVTGLTECKQCSIGRWAPAGSSQCRDIPNENLAQIVKPPADETKVGYMVSASSCGQLTSEECQAAAVSLGKDFGFNNQNGIVEWDTMSTGCVQSGQDWLYFNTHAGNDKCDDTNYCKHVCKRPKCDPPVEPMVYEVSASPCEQYTETEEECKAVADSQGETFYGSFSHASYPPKCYRQSGTWYFNTDANAAGWRCSAGRNCACKRLKTAEEITQDKKDACIAVNGCWWHGDKCTEGCDQRAKDFDNKICGSTKTQLEEEYRQLNQC